MTSADARAFYVHSILHDWDDTNGRQILSNLAAAMIPEYSKLLINENVIPKAGAYGRRLAWASS